MLHWVEDRAVVEFATEMAEEYVRRDGSAAVLVALGFSPRRPHGAEKVKYWGRAFSLGSEMAESKARIVFAFIFEPGEKEGRVAASSCSRKPFRFVARPPRPGRWDLGLSILPSRRARAGRTQRAWRPL